MHLFFIVRLVLNSHYPMSLPLGWKSHISGTIWPTKMVHLSNCRYSYMLCTYLPTPMECRPVLYAPIFDGGLLLDMSLFSRKSGIKKKTKKTNIILPLTLLSNAFDKWTNLLSKLSLDEKKCITTFYFNGILSACNLLCLLCFENNSKSALQELLVLPSQGAVNLML